MPHKAYTRDNPMADGLDLALVHRANGWATVTTWATDGYAYQEAESTGAKDPVDGMWLSLSDDQARAIYEALAQHYGGTAPTDTRLLREDYVAERARVDLLIRSTLGLA